MKDEITNRVLILAKHIIFTGDTLRKTAKIYGLSKSTVHNDVSYKLKRIDAGLYKKVAKILDVHFSQKHIRGGEATKHKYHKERVKENEKENS